MARFIRVCTGEQHLINLNTIADIRCSNTNISFIKSNGSEAAIFVAKDSVDASGKFDKIAKFIQDDMDNVFYLY